MKDLNEVREVTLAHIRTRLGNSHVTILDVLPRETFDTAHLPGAINIPLAELERRAPRELPDRSREIVTYCGGPT